MKKLSIVVPILNESKYLKPFLDALLHVRDIAEVIIVDGGSKDDSLEIAAKYPVLVLRSEKGRAVQMNAGCRASKSEFILFLHVDTYLDESFKQILLDVIKREASLASFRLTFKPSNPILQFYAFFSKVNHPWVYFGDQGLWVKRSLFEMMHGFDEKCIILEDQEFYLRASKKVKPVKLPFFLKTSSRAYQEYGSIRLQLLYGRIWMLFKLGYSQEKLLEIKKRFQLDKKTKNQ